MEIVLGRNYLFSWKTLKLYVIGNNNVTQEYEIQLCPQITCCRSSCSDWRQGRTTLVCNMQICLEKTIYLQTLYAKECYPNLYEDNLLTKS
jgi:hypothetical protein